MGFADRIKLAREKKGVSQATLGNAVGRSQSTVGEWETGESEPRRSIIPKIAKYLGVDIGWLEYEELVEHQPQQIATLKGIPTETSKEPLVLNGVRAIHIEAALIPILGALGIREMSAELASRLLIQAIEVAQSLPESQLRLHPQEPEPDDSTSIFPIKPTEPKHKQ